MAEGTLEVHGEPAVSIVTLFQQVYRIGKFWEARWTPRPMKFWFRGVDDEAHGLDPGLLRPPYAGGDLEQIEYSTALEFRIRGRPYFTSEPRNAWEEMFLMQHYGFPTRLLDWTESLAAAAYFAARDISSNTDGAVWMLAPQWLINRAHGEHATRLFATHEWLKPYELRTHRLNLTEFNCLAPMPLLPECVDSRIIAQQGRFTVHTFKTGTLEALGCEDEATCHCAAFLQKIRIPASAKATMRQQARIVGGASEDALFPGLEGLARGMRWEALERVREGRSCLMGGAESSRARHRK